MWRRWHALFALVLPAAVAAIILATPIASGYQHVTNGSFESGTQAWSISGATARSVPASEMPPAHGSTSLEVTLAESRGMVRQPIGAPLGPGAYAVSVQAKSDDGVGIRLIVDLDSGERTEFIDAPAPGSPWTAVGGTVSVPRGSIATLTIEVQGTPGAVSHLDDVQLDGAPPATFTPTPSATPVATTPSATAVTTPGTTPTASTAVDVISAFLRNGGFEQVDPAGVPLAWETYGGSLSAASGPVRTGSHAARLESNSDSTKWLHQAVLVQPDDGYVFGAWVLGDGGVASAFLRISWYASADASGTAISSVDSTSTIVGGSVSFQFLTTGTVQAPSTARSARLRVMLAPHSGARATMHVDDAAFGPAMLPPPPQASPAPAATGQPLANAAPHTGGATSRTSTSRVIRTSSTSVRPDHSGSVALASTARVIINEVLYDSAASGPDTEAEWVELYNAGDVAVDLAGWRIGDGASSDTLPSLSLGPRRYAIVAASDSFFAIHPGSGVDVIVLGSRIGNGLGNEGDFVALADAAGALVDIVSWGDDTTAFTPPVGTVPEGHSIERRTPGLDTGRAADFVDNERPSPGGPYRPNIVGSLGSDSPAVEILEGARDTEFGWLPWAMAATSAVALASVLGWRALESFRRRTPIP